jgi:type VI secretion system protein ImpC
MRTTPDRPFRIAVLGNFRGDSIRPTTPLQPIRIDRDNLDQVMRDLGVRLDGIKTHPNSSPCSVHFSSIADFHPDHLFESLAVFEPLRRVRERLHDDAAVDDVVGELLRLGVSGEAPSNSPPSAPLVNDLPQEPNLKNASVTDTSLTDASLLEQILELETDSGANQPPERKPAGEWQQVIESIVAPYAVSGADPRKSELLAAVDESLQGLMAAVLHHEKFQALEATWRALHLLVHGLETSAQLCVYLIDVSKSELAADLVGATDLTQSKLYRALVEEAAEDSIEGAAEERWSMLVADFAFGSRDDDAVLLRQLAKLAAITEAPLAAGVDFSQLQSVSSEPWQSLRHAAEAAFLSLVWPRFLLRLPYGADSKPIDSFHFEEVRESDSPPQLLWGNSAYLIALLLGQAFGEAAPGAPLNPRRQVEGLPVWMRKRDGVIELHPCGERLITDSMAEQLQTLGITPLISIRDRDIVCLPQWISLSGGKLRGRWLDPR